VDGVEHAPPERQSAGETAGRVPRGQRDGSALADLGRDLRSALRVLATNRGLATAAVVTLGLGMGVTLGLLGVVDTVLVRPLAYRQPDRLVLVWGQLPGLGLADLWLSGPEYRDLAEQTTSFADIAILRGRDLSLTGTPDPLPIKAVAVTGNFFRLLGVSAAAGRVITPEDDRPGEGKVAVLSHGTALRLFGGAALAVGRTVQLNGEAYVVLGVMPRSFRVPPPDGLLPRQADLWVPIARDVSRMSRDLWFFNALARLRPGVSLGTAREEVRALARRASREFPAAYQGEPWELTLSPYQEYLTRGVRPALLILLAIVALVLLIACANVASLLLAMAMVRSRESALRAAVGAGGWALARRALVESTLLAGLGSLLGLGLAGGVDRALAALGPGDLPRLEEVRVDGRLLAFAVALAFAVTLLAGLGPALRSARPRLAEVLHQDDRGGSGRSAQRSLGLLVAAEVALALVPLVATGLLGKSLLRMARVDPGFRAEGVMTCKIRPPQNKYPKDAQKAVLYDRILDQVRGLPGIVAAGAISALPLSGAYPSGTFAAPGAAPGHERFQADLLAITPGFFEVLRIPLREGRAFGPQDVETGAPVALVDASLARRLWPGTSALGQQVRLLGLDEPTVRQDGEPAGYRVVGVVASSRSHGLGEPSVEQVYLPLRQKPWVSSYLVARGRAAAPAALRRTVRSVDPDQAVSDLRPLADYLRDSAAQLRFDLLLSGLFAALSLLLASVGTYGVMDYVFGQRIREMGIRLALGAPPRGVIRLMVSRGMRFCLAGLAGGLLAAAAAARMLGTLLFGVAPYDAAVFLAAPVLLAAVAALACYLPARKLLTKDPLAALRP
jgi:putative ABC transport system permease protein